MKKQTLFAVILALAMVLMFALSGCSSSATGDNSTPAGTGGSSNAAMIMVGVSVGNEDANSATGTALQSGLESAGYTVELAYASDATEQAKQISAMVEDGAKILIVDPLDTEDVKARLESIAVDVSDVVVVAYGDNMESSAVNVYVGRDAKEFGKQSAEEVLSRFGLSDADDEVKEPYTVELLADGGSTSQQAVDSAMSVLKPYVTSGAIEILSGHTTGTACKTSDATKTITNLMSNTYADRELNAVLCFGRGQATAVVDSILTGYQGNIYPVVTCGDVNSETVQYLSKNLVDLLSYYDETELVSGALSAVQSAVNSAESGELSVTEKLSANTAVTADNYNEILVESGLYTFNNDGSYSKN